MSSPARAARRRSERAQKKQGQRVNPRPSGSNEVNVEWDEQYTYFTCMAGNIVVTLQWTHEDAAIVADMVKQATTKERPKEVEVVRQSGLIVPPKAMRL